MPRNRIKIPTWIILGKRENMDNPGQTRERGGYERRQDEAPVDEG